MNLARSQAVLRFCIQRGVREIVICAGARNVPLIDLVTEIRGLRAWSFFDERSAGFFALGRIEQSGSPVAVLTTSGTAVAELLPACIEAHYQGRPLILVTADRPKRFRGTGSPQAIEQNGIFGSMVETCVDIEDHGGGLSVLKWTGAKPLHLNVCLEEPQSHRPNPSDLRAAAESCGLLLAQASPEGPVSPVVAPGPEPVWSGEGFSCPLIVVGPVARSWRDRVRGLLLQSRAPIYAESLSGLTGDPEIVDRLVFSEEVAQALIQANVCRSVVRVGGVPTLRLWRDLEDKCRDLPVLNLVPPEAAWSGLARPTGVTTLTLNHGLSGFLERSMDARFERPARWKEFSSAASAFFQDLVRRHPSAEPSLVEALSRSSRECRVYVGNSLPVREWDWVSPGRSYRGIYANRGANGIDGQIDTSLGWSLGETDPTMTLVGDLTALYGLSSLAATPQLGDGARHVVVLNNGGGMIFRRIFPQPTFLNAHDLSFAGWARMFGWSYRSWSNTRDFPMALEADSGNWVTELRPDPGQSEAFRREWREWLEREVPA